MAKKKISAGSANAEDPVASLVDVIPEEGIIVNRVARIISDQQGETGVAVAGIRAEYLKRYPRSQADVMLGEREFASIALYLQAHGYAVQQKKLWSLTDKGRELAAGGEEKI